ncbi:MAG: S24/S26 family peptidase [Candidatus Binatus sp.]
MEAGLNNLDRIGCELVAESVRAGHDVRVRVSGSSMLPTLWPGDELLVRAHGSAEPSRGELVLFVRDGRLCTHRLIGRLDGAGAAQLIMRGDTAIASDPPVAASEILGTVALISRGGREVQISTSPAQKLISFGIRHSDFLRRAVLKIHSIRRRLWTD